MVTRAVTLTGNVLAWVSISAWWVWAPRCFAPTACTHSIWAPATGWAELDILPSGRVQTQNFKLGRVSKKIGSICLEKESVPIQREEITHQDSPRKQLECSSRIPQNWQERELLLNQRKSIQQLDKALPRLCERLGKPG